MARKKKLQQFSSNTKVYGWWKTAVDAFDTWRTDALLDRYYYENRQWSDSDAAKLEKVGQPVITINHIYPKVNMLVGLLLQNRPTIVALPRGRDDAEVASIATKVVRYIFDVNNVNAKQAEAFTDMATTGIGWLEVRATSVLGKDPIAIDYVPWSEVLFDPLSRQPDLSDARFVWRGKWVDRDMVEEFFPESKDIFKAVGGGPHMSSAAYAMPGADDREWYDRRRERCFLLECQYKVFSKEQCYWDGTQVTKYVPHVHDQALALGIGKLTEARIPVVRQMFVLGDYILRDEELPYMHGNFTLVPFVAQRDYDGNPVGLVRYLRDMQDEINKRRSKVLHYLTAKRVIAEEGAVDDPDAFMAELARPDAFVEHRKGYNIEVQQDLELGAQHFQLMKEAADEMSTITGIYPDFQGIPTNARTGAAIRQRVMQSQTATQKYFSAVERALKTICESCLALARQYYTTQRVIQLTDEPYAIVLNEPVPDPTTGRIVVRNSLATLRADIVVKVEPGGQTQRQQELIQLVELLKTLPPEMVMMSLDVLIDAFDVPQKAIIKQRFQQMVAAAQQAQQQGQQQPQAVSQGGNA